MTEFIGSRISLISKRDIRYVGTLHEISSENSTVALENVTSYGTEGRRPDEEVPPNLDNTYEYIVFRGSDVKDLRIEEVPKEPKKAPQMPDDPAILGSTRRPSGTVNSGPKSPDPLAYSSHAPSGHADSTAPVIPKQNPPTRQQPPSFQQPPYPYHFGPQRFAPGGAGGFPPGAAGYGFQNLPYGPPPGWFPPHGFPQHLGPGHFSPPGLHVGPGGQQPITAGQTASSDDAPPAPMPVEPTDIKIANETKPLATVRLPSSSSTPVPQQISHEGALRDLVSDGSSTLTAPEAGLGPVGPSKNVSKQKLVPAIPLSPASQKATSLNGTAQSAATNVEDKRRPGTPKSLEEANRDARAAVAAAMAKLPPEDKKPAESSGALDNVTKAIGELKTSEASKPVRGNRGGRSVFRGGRDNSRRVEVPRTDFDFETANAKFNKHDLVKEAIATGSPVEDSSYVINNSITTNGQENAQKGNESNTGIHVGVSYNRSSSFFDDISSEIKDRAEGNETRQRVAGREFRNEERQKNLETFGQGSVDNNYRHGRVRGRSRGYTRGRAPRGYGNRSSNRGRQQFAAAAEGQSS